MEMATQFDGDKVTIYFTNDFGFGIGSLEARLYETGTKQYAQYANAAYCRYKKKGARTKRGMIASGYRPWLVILEGWGLPKFDNWQPPQDDGAVITQKGKFMGCDERWEMAGDIFVADVVGKTGAETVADYRHTHGFNAHDRFQDAG